jgi:hypothetical protein
VITRPQLITLARHRDDAAPEWRWVWDRLMIAWVPALDPWIGVGPQGTAPVTTTTNNVSVYAGVDGEVEPWRAEIRVDVRNTPSLMNAGLTIADYSMARERGNRAPGWVVGDGTNRAGTYMGSGSGLWERLLEPPGAYDSNSLTFPLRRYVPTIATIASGDQRYYMDGTAGTSRTTTFAPSWGLSTNLAVGSTDGALEWYHRVKCTIVLFGPTQAREVERINEIVRTQGPFRWRRRRAYFMASSGPQTGTLSQAILTITALTPSASAGAVSPVPAQAVVTLTGLTPAGASLATGTPAIAELVLSALAPAGVPAPVTGTPAQAVLTLLGLDPTGSAGGISGAPGIASLLLSALDPTANPGALIAVPGQAVLTLTALAPSSNSDTLGDLAQATFALSALTPTGSAGAITASPAIATLTLSALDPTPGIGAVNATPGIAELLLSALTPSLSSGVFADAGQAALTFTALTPSGALGGISGTPGLAILTFTADASTGIPGAVSAIPGTATVTLLGLTPTGVVGVIATRIYRATIYGGAALGVTVHGGHALQATIEGED